MKECKKCGAQFEGGGEKDALEAHDLSFHPSEDSAAPAGAPAPAPARPSAKKADLVKRAEELGIDGAKRMKKADLVAAIEAAEAVA